MVSIDVATRPLRIAVMMAAVAVVWLEGCYTDRAPTFGADDAASRQAGSGGAGGSGATGGIGGMGGNDRDAWVSPSTGGTGGGAGAGGSGGTAADAGLDAGLDAGDPSPLGDCAGPGIWGARASVDVYWGGRTVGLAGLTNDGRGRVTMDLRFDIQQVDAGSGEVQGSARVCDVELPPFTSSSLCEAYGPVFPPAMWEAPEMPEIPLSGRWRCGAESCSLELDPVTALHGIKLSSPDAAWPAPTSTRTAFSCGKESGSGCFPDHDGNGLPGVTVELRTKGAIAADCQGFFVSGDYDYEAAPLSASPEHIFNAAVRADRIHLGLRNRLGATIDMGEDCTSGTGQAQARYLQSRAWSCHLQEGSGNSQSGDVAGPDQECTDSEALFMDQNLPQYYVLEQGQSPPSTLSGLSDTSASRGPLLSLVRLGDSGEKVGCDRVRGASYDL